MILNVKIGNYDLVISLTYKWGNQGPRKETDLRKGVP